MQSNVPQFLRRCFLSTLVYVVTVWCVVWLLKHPLLDADTSVRAVVALLPMLPITYVVRLLLQHVMSGDEMQQRIDLEAIAVAGIVVSLGTLTLSLLMIAGVFHTTGRQAMAWVFPALWIAYGFARAWAARRYQ